MFKNNIIYYLWGVFYMLFHRGKPFLITDSLTLREKVFFHTMVKSYFQKHYSIFHSYFVLGKTFFIFKVAPIKYS